MSWCSTPHLESLIWKVFWKQTGHMQTSTSRVSGFRGPQQGTSKACLVPIWKQIHWWREVKGPKPDDHTTEWPKHRTLPWQSRNRPCGKFKGSKKVLPKFICWNSFISAPDVVHCVSFRKAFPFKCETSKVARLLRFESIGNIACSQMLHKLCKIYTLWGPFSFL